MNPSVNPSPYHDHKPLCHDLPYHLEDGTPVLEDQDE